MQNANLVVRINQFTGSYTWGIGDKGSLLHQSDLELRGSARAPSVEEELVAVINIDTLNDAEPTAIEDSHDVVAIGTVEQTNKTIRASAVMPRSGIAFILQLLNSGDPMDLILTHGPFEEGALGWQKSELLRLTLM